MYEKYCVLRDAKGVKDATVAREIGIGQSTFTDWKSGRSSPKKEKLQKIADYFGVPIEYFWGSEKTDTPYYINTETRELAQFLFENPEYRVLFDASRKVRKEDIEFIRQMIERASK